MSTITSFFDPQNSWQTFDLRPDSIPHLLHWDLAYLWVLEREARQRPETWKRRIEAWRVLVENFLIGRDKMSIETEVLRNPMKGYAEPLGITKVDWIMFNGKAVGVLSPTVLIRPLPDYEEEMLPSALEGNEQKALLAHYSRIVLNQISTYVTEHENSNHIAIYAKKLGSILRREILAPDKAITTSPKVQYREKSIEVPILAKLTWTPTSIEQPLAYLHITLPDREKVPASFPIFAPVCDTCGKPLALFGSEKEIVIKTSSDTAFELKCTGDEEHLNNVQLEDLFVWNSDQKVIVWDPESLKGHDTSGDRWRVPPRPDVAGALVTYRWDPGQIGGEQQNCFLRIRFAHVKEVLVKRIEELFFEKVIKAKDDEEGLRLIPIRRSLLGACLNPGEIKSRWEGPFTYFDNIRVKGLPRPIRKEYPTSRSMLLDQFGVGVFPNPRSVNKKWKQFRVFVTGQDAADIKLDTSLEELRQKLSYVHDGTFLDELSVEIVLGNAGATFLVDRGSGETDDHPESLFLGVDFGTTNSVIYWSKERELQERKASDYAFLPESVSSHVFWLMRSKTFEAGPSIAHVLPGEAYASKSFGKKDRAIIPSVLWVDNTNKVIGIRWSNVEPKQNVLALKNFKWAITQSHLRKAYWTELLFLCLPAIIHKANYGRIADLRLSLGVAFPLAFTDQEKQDMRELLKTLESYCIEHFGITRVIVNSINESAACVKALGEGRRNDVVLVADMGGGTLDVAAVEWARTREREFHFHQIGSLKFAGTDLVQALNPGSDSNKTQELQDRLALGEGLHDDVNAESYIEKGENYFFMVFEFLRLMAETQKKQGAGSIYYLLVGNGWHFLEAFDKRAKVVGPANFGKEQRKAWIRRFDENGIDEMTEMLRERFENSKHVVAWGALTIACAGVTKELEKDPQLSKLPCGRKVVLKNKDLQIVLDWNTLVGSDTSVRIERLDSEAAKTVSPEFDLSNGESSSVAWKKLEYPNALELRKTFLRGLQRNEVSKGVIQDLLENHWKHNI